MRGAVSIPGRLLVGLACFATPAAAASPPNEEAAAAYDRGAAAFDKGDYAKAAVELGRADELAPNSVTLELAINAVMKTEDAALAMTLVDRTDQRDLTKKLDAAAHAARRKFASRVGRVSVICPPPAPCVARLDDAPLAVGHLHYVTIGRHDVRVVRGNTSERMSIDVAAGKTVQVVPKLGDDKPEPALDIGPSPYAGDDSGGISPVWFWVGVGATAVLGGATLASGLDALSRHDRFQDDRSDGDAASSGRNAQTRTNILLGATGVLAAATAATGIFFVRWSSSSTTRAAVAGPSLVLRTEF